MIKKLLSTLLFIPFFIYPSQQLSQTDVVPWRHNFQKLKDAQSVHACQALNRWQKLGYNPDITLLEKNSAAIFQKNGPTLFIHGWLGGKDAYKSYKLCSSDNIPGDVVTFNFPDASYWFKQTIFYGMPVTKSSFAGKLDILALLAVLKTLHDIECLPAVWYPHSRGAGVTQAVVAILNKPESNEQEILNEWEITEQIRTDILSTLKIVYLLTPLTNFDSALNKQIQTKIASLDYLFPSLRTKIIFPLLKNHILPWLTHYDPQQKNPIDYIAQWQGLKAAVWLHLEENDCDVSNDNDENLIELLKGVIPEKSLYVSCVNNGGHNAYEIFINTIIHSFYFLHDCISCKSEVPLHENIPLNNARLDYKKNIKQHLSDFSQTSTKNKGFWEHRMTQRLKNIFLVLCFGSLLYYLNKSSYGICGFHVSLTQHYFSIYK